MFGKRLLWVLMGLLLVPCMLAVYAFSHSVPATEYTVEMALSGDRVITLEYGTEFDDPGAVATLTNVETGEQKTGQVQVSGRVDTQTVGTYTLRYTAEAGKTQATLYRQIRVVDTQAPTIELVADPEVYTLPGHPYEEEGFRALDAYDGDLTENVVRYATEAAVFYTVTDSSGNKTQVSREIVYNDPIAPELTLLGKNLIILDQGAKYTEEGCKALDNCDGDLTEKVSISGKVDTSQPGKYTIIYTVEDAYKNKTSTTRIVFVKEDTVEQVNDPNKGGKVIYLTFDDGPGAYTPKLLDILKKYNVPATFFVVNTRAIGTIKRAAEEGHTVAIHTATHVFSQIYANEEAYFDDLYKMQAIIETHTGIRTNLLRFPGGSSNRVSSDNKGLMTRLTKMVEELGFVYFDWNVDSKDAGGARTAEDVYWNVVTGVRGKTNAVVLMHDIKSYTVDAVEDIIIWGLKNGYTFQALTENSPTCHHRVNN